MVFPIDFGIRILMEISGTWAEVKNTVTYRAQPGQDAIFLRPTGDIFSENIVGAKPDITSIDLTTPTKFQVIITGHLCDDVNVTVEKSIPFTVLP